MTFIRIKQIKNKSGKSYPYAYVVENRWKGKKVVQKVSKYLGRVYEFERGGIKDLTAFLKTSLESYTGSAKNQDILADLVSWTLEGHGFRKEGEWFCRDNLKVSPASGEVLAKKRPAVLHLGDGFLCKHTIMRLKRFRRTGDEEKDIFRLAVYFVESGIKVPKEIVGEFYIQSPKNI